MSEEIKVSDSAREAAKIFFDCHPDYPLWPAEAKLEYAAKQYQLGIANLCEIHKQEKERIECAAKTRERGIREEAQKTLDELAQCKADLSLRKEHMAQSATVERLQHAVGVALRDIIINAQKACEDCDAPTMERIKELEKDKVRLDWLNSTGRWIRVWSLESGARNFNLHDGEGGFIETDNLRSAIDAAMNKEGE
jgi:hypothetical protein